MRGLGYLLTLMMGGAFANADSNSLENISSARNADGFQTRLTFSGPVDTSKITTDYINTTLQFNFPETKVTPSKVFTNVKDEKVKNLFTYQTDRELVRSRIIYNKGTNADSLKEKIQIAADGNAVVITVKDGSDAAAVSAPSTLPEIVPVVLSAGGEAPPASTSSILRAEMNVSDTAPVVQTPSDVATSNGATAATTTEKNLTEEQIPVLTKTEAKAEIAEKPSAVKFLGAFFVVLVAIAGAALWGRKVLQKKAASRPGTTVKVIAQHYLGPKRSVAVIRVAGESLLVGVTDGSVNLIKTLSLIDDEVPEEVPQNFYKTLTKAGQNPQPAQPRQGFSPTEGEEPDEFSFKVIRDRVSDRLKGLKNT